MFTVRWKRAARDELAKIWVQADSTMRQAITAAANQVDAGLKRNPESKGESRGDAERVWFAPPLCVFFKVDVDRSLVRVVGVRILRRRS